MGVTELFLSLPWLYFLLGVRAFLPLHLSTIRTFFLLTGVIGLIGWARPARLVRGVVLSARNRNYVLAARGFGGSDFYLLRRHILPETFRRVADPGGAAGSAVYCRRSNAFFLRPWSE